MAEEKYIFAASRWTRGESVRLGCGSTFYPEDEEEDEEGG